MKEYSKIRPGSMDAGIASLLYAINTTLLLVHEIDSARWAEWDLFRLPFGAAGFLVIHLLLIPLVLWGGLVVVRQVGPWRLPALLLGVVGLAGATVHTLFLLAGDLRFSTPESVALIAAFGLSSLIQILHTTTGWRRLPTSPGSEVRAT